MQIWLIVVYLKDVESLQRAKDLRTRLLALAKSGPVGTPEPKTCWNCKQPGHERADCPLRELGIVNFVCFHCCEDGKTVKTCPKCGPERKARRKAGKLQRSRGTQNWKNTDGDY